MRLKGTAARWVWRGEALRKKIGRFSRGKKTATPVGEWPFQLLPYSMVTQMLWVTMKFGLSYRLSSGPTATDALNQSESEQVQAK